MSPVDRFLERAKKMIECDTARISTPCGTMFLVVGWNKNTKDDSGVWTDQNGNNVADWDYVHETVIASGKTLTELESSFDYYIELRDKGFDAKRLSDILGG